MTNSVSDKREAANDGGVGSDAMWELRAIIVFLVIVIVLGLKWLFHLHR